MRLGRLEVVGADGARVRRSCSIGTVSFRDGVSVAEVDLDYFLVRRILGPAPGGTTVRILGPSQPPPAPSPDPAPCPPPAAVPQLTPAQDRMRKAREAKKAKAASARATG